MTSETQQLTAVAGIRIERLSRVDHNGELAEIDLSGPATIIYGPRNSSKTTTLKIIDYCLGDPDSAIKSLGEAVAGRYVEFSAEILLNGVRHSLSRSLDKSSKRVTKTRVDDQRDLNARELSDWLLRELNWPNVDIPLGRNQSSATQLIPLTFRTLLRHIYRREDSWLEFAVKEEEFYRRAVISLFLGLATSRYSGEEFRLGQAERRYEEAQARAREATEIADEAIRSVTQELGMQPVGLLALSELQSHLERDLDSLVAERTRIQEAPRREDGWEPELGALYGSVCQELERIKAHEAQLLETIDSYEESEGLIRSQTARLERLQTSASLFDEIPVTMCPACEQKINPERDHDAHSCYLCSLPVQPDLRHRRIEVELRSLEREQEDLTGVLQRTREELLIVRERIGTFEASREELTSRLNDRRGQLLAPFVRQLEDFAAAETSIRQKLAAIRGLEHLVALVASAEHAVQQAQQAVEDAQRAFRSIRVDKGSAINRCSLFAERMNEFLGALNRSVWVHRSVTLSENEFTFYVGTRPWDQALGAETKVIFFLAYSYALLHLHVDLPEVGNAPGLLLLDNPYQQGLAGPVVEEALGMITTAANVHNAQVLITAARLPRLTASHRSFRMTQTFDT
ncbi:hypothetical protein ACBJ59_60515 [Nonomuraea sp. MTCD27]|uniref:hypothetical protein n=1 Tax=Nonomuraea sp. MTCD27 TaxID=1676747 RepID=UPI0035C16D46